MMKNIAILLSTYNGGEYLKEQLDSIFEQDYQNFTLYVRDDGSTDDTILVLNSYLDKYSNMVVMEDSKRHRGANESFLWLLNHVEADYYMFCDQDDIWLKEKISTQVTAISSVNINDLNAKPVLVFHDLILTTNRGKIMSQSFWETHSMNVKGIKFSEIFVKNVVTGCTSMINNEMKRALLVFDKHSMIMYDHALALIGYSYGETIVLDKQLILYRDHNNSVTPKRKITLKFRLKNATKSVFNKNYLMQNIQQMQNFEINFSPFLSEKQKDVIKKFITLKKYPSFIRFLLYKLRGI